MVLLILVKYVLNVSKNYISQRGSVLELLNIMLVNMSYKDGKSWLLHVLYDKNSFNVIQNEIYIIILQQGAKLIPLRKKQ